MGLRQVMGLYQKPVTADLGIGRETFSLAIAIANIVWGIAAPFSGAISDRYGSGRIVVIGAVTTAARSSWCCNMPAPTFTYSFPASF